MIINVEKSHLAGVANPPSSKSYAIRWIFLSLVLDDIFELKDLNLSEDVETAINVVKSFGVKASYQDGNLILDGTKKRFQEEVEIDCGLSATVLRLSIPLGLCFAHRLIIKARPKLIERGISDYYHLLKDCSIINLSDSWIIEGEIKEANFELSLKNSSQYASALLLFLARKQKGEIKFDYPNPYFLLTKDVLEEAGFKFSLDNNILKILEFKKKSEYKIFIKKDATLAFYLESFNLFGSNIFISEDLSFDFNYRELKDYLLKKKTIDLRKNIDLAPIMFVVAGISGGYTFTNFSSLRNKESNRLETFLDALARCGLKYQLNDDLLIIGKSNFKDLIFEDIEDHRLVFALMPLLSLNGGRLTGKLNIEKSYPAYFDELARLGLVFRKEI